MADAGTNTTKDNIIDIYYGNCYTPFFEVQFTSFYMVYHIENVALDYKPIMSAWKFKVTSYIRKTFQNIEKCSHNEIVGLYFVSVILCY